MAQEKQKSGTLVIFVKEPRIGRVKTRLARDIGMIKAWRFYKRTVRGLIKRVGFGNWQTVICVSPDGYKGAFFDKRFKIVPQGRGDLGQRMQRVFDNVGTGPVVLIGGDIPSVGKHHIKNAFDALGNNDIVFGPATDGGYWLVGMRRRRSRISPFEEVRWSTKHALSDTINNIDPMHRYAFADMLSDVDTAKDL